MGEGDPGAGRGPAPATLAPRHTLSTSVDFVDPSGRNIYLATVMVAFFARILFVLENELRPLPACHPKYPPGSNTPTGVPVSLLPAFLHRHLRPLLITWRLSRATEAPQSRFGASEEPGCLEAPQSLLQVFPRQDSSFAVETHTPCIFQWLFF